MRWDLREVARAHSGDTCAALITVTERLVPARHA